MGVAFSRPRPVPPGGVIGVVSPAGPVPADALEAGLARLHAWGYRTVVGEHALDRRGYLAGDDGARASDFNRIWADPAVDAVICARGGYGAMRMLEQIDWEMVRRTPKFFCGFSDITALHFAMAQRAGLVTFHGPMVGAFGGAEAYNAEGLRRALQETSALGLIPWPASGSAPVPAPETTPGSRPGSAPGPESVAGAASQSVPQPFPQPVVVRPGVAEGTLLGGNLSLVTAMIGTPWEPDLRGSILLLEDVDEPPYQIDRMLMQLKLSGRLQGLKGILFGDTVPAPTEKPTLTLQEVLEEHLGDLGIPVLFGFPCGHTPYRATLPLGVQARLDATNATLTILEPALAR